MATYDNRGVQFRYPAEWELSEDEDDSGQTMVHVQSPATAYWSLTLTDGRQQAEPLFDAVADALGSEYGELDQHTPEITDPIAGHAAVARTFEFVVHELPVVAEARVVWIDEDNDAAAARTALVLWQYADAEAEEVETLLERMTASIQTQPLAA